MKKLIPLMMFLVAATTGIAQTTVQRIIQANKDTMKVSNVPPVYTKEQYKPAVITPAVYVASSFVLGHSDTIILKYKAPVIPGGGTKTGTGVTPPPVTGGRVYKVSGALTLTAKDNNTTISGLSFDAMATAITVNGAQHVHITKCRFTNITSYTVLINSASSDITVDSCFFNKVAFGVYATGKIIKVNGNQCLNLNWNNNPQMYAHFAQLVGVNSGGNQINNNRIENIVGQAYYPHDIISVFESNGLPGDSIQVIGNWIRGGQTAYPSADAGGAGIGLGDYGGSYQVARNNILVNP